MTIFRILQAFVNWSTVSPPVRSAIARNCHPGQIFVEAASFNAANSVARQFDVLNKSDVRVLPCEEAHLCLLGGIRFTPSADSWIKIRKGWNRDSLLQSVVTCTVDTHVTCSRYSRLYHHLTQPAIRWEASLPVPRSISRGHCLHLLRRFSIAAY